MAMRAIVSKPSRLKRGNGLYLYVSVPTLFVAIDRPVVLYWSSSRNNYEAGVSTINSRGNSHGCHPFSLLLSIRLPN